MSKTTDGFWVEAGPVLAFEQDDVAAIANGVRSALAASKVDVETPSPGSLRSQLPEVAGVKSFAAFMRGAVSVDIASDDVAVTLTPMRNGGSRNGFEFKTDAALTVNDEGLEAGLHSALEEAE